jgi:hypothetical protein
LPSGDIVAIGMHSIDKCGQEFRGVTVKDMHVGDPITALMMKKSRCRIMSTKSFHTNQTTSLS